MEMCQSTITCTYLLQCTPGHEMKVIKEWNSYISIEYSTWRFVLLLTSCSAHHMTIIHNRGVKQIMKPILSAWNLFTTYHKCKCINQLKFTTLGVAPPPPSQPSVELNMWNRSMIIYILYIKSLVWIVFF